MPRIVRAEFLSYYNPRRNSDKLFNVFLIEDDDRTFRCISEYGRRGNTLVRDTLCRGATREFAMSQLRHKLFAKRNHRETPYTNETFGSNYSQLARELEFNAAGSASPGTNQVNRQSSARTPPRKDNVVAFPAQKREKPRQQPKQSGILNQEQLDSLEI